jgi:hypothetical protein
MSFKAPKAPQAPDPYATAQAQTASNVNTAVANTVLGNANERNPYGSVTYKQTGGTNVGGQFVPSYTRTQKESKAQRKLRMGQEAAGVKMNSLANSQLSRLKNTLNEPLSFDGLPEHGKLADPPKLDELSGKDYSADRLRVEQAMTDRMRPEMERSRAAQEARLASQGINLGTDAYREGHDQIARNENDARLGVVLAGGQEQSRMLNEERQGVGFNNNTRIGGYNMSRNKAEFDETLRERAMQEELQLRNQPINEVSALMSGGQVSMPQFKGFEGGDVAPTPVGQYVYNTAGLNQDTWKSQNEAAASDRKGLYDIAAAGVGGWMKYR